MLVVCWLLWVVGHLSTKFFKNWVVSMEIFLILVVIAIIVGNQENKGVWKYVPHLNRNARETEPHASDWSIWGG